MESKESLILGLAKMLQNNGTYSPVCKLPSIEIKTLKTPNVVNQNDLLSFLNSRLVCAWIDTSKAKGYLLMPFSNNLWKVFVIDNDNKPYAQLDDYTEIINVNINGASTEYKEPFVINR